MVRPSIVILMFTQNGKWTMNIHFHFKIQISVLRNALVTEICHFVLAF